jgi:hypothetical protein
MADRSAGVAGPGSCPGNPGVTRARTRLNPRADGLQNEPNWRRARRHPEGGRRANRGTSTACPRGTRRPQDALLQNEPNAPCPTDCETNPIRPNTLPWKRICMAAVRHPFPGQLVGMWVTCGSCRVVAVGFPRVLAVVVLCAHLRNLRTPSWPWPVSCASRRARQSLAGSVEISDGVRLRRMPCVAVKPCAGRLDRRQSSHLWFTSRLRNEPNARAVLFDNRIERRPCLSRVLRLVVAGPVAGTRPPAGRGRSPGGRGGPAVVRLVAAELPSPRVVVACLLVAVRRGRCPGLPSLPVGVNLRKSAKSADRPWSANRLSAERTQFVRTQGLADGYGASSQSALQAVRPGVSLVVPLRKSAKSVDPSLWSATLRLTRASARGILLGFAGCSEAPADAR